MTMPCPAQVAQVMSSWRSHAEVALDEFAPVAGQRQPLLAFEQPGLFQLAPHRARDRKRQPRLARGILQAQRAGAVDGAQQCLDAGGSLAQTRRLRYQLQNRRRGHYFLISLAIRLTRALSALIASEPGSRFLFDAFS